MKIRRDLHQIPELEFDVFETAEYIEKQLNLLGIEHYRLAKTGIVAIIRGKNANIFLYINIYDGDCIWKFFYISSI